MHNLGESVFSRTTLMFWPIVIIKQNEREDILSSYSSLHTLTLPKDASLGLSLEIRPL